MIDVLVKYVGKIITRSSMYARISKIDLTSDALKFVPKTVVKH